MVAVGFLVKVEVTNTTGLHSQLQSCFVCCLTAFFHDFISNDFHRHGAGIGPVWISNISCTGAENSPFKCPMNHLGKADSECASHNYDLSIKCDDAGNLTRKSPCGKRCIVVNRKSL